MIILASKSPRRKELLSNLFGDINIQTSNVEETYSSVRPSNIVMELSRKKLQGIVSKDNDIVISADTIVYFKGEILGKPKNEEDAYRMLTMLSNNTHSVYTGVSIKQGVKVVSFYDKSLVRFKKLLKEDILAYIKTGSPMDKAGAYGIQDKWLIDYFKGSYNNIVGLPTERLIEELKSFKVEGKWQN